MQRNTFGALAAAATLVAAGCGGTEPLTRAELVRQADVICKRATNVIHAANRRVTAAGSRAEGIERLERAGEVYSAATRREVAAMRELEAPVVMQSAFRRYLATLQARDELQARWLTTAKSLRPAQLERYRLGDGSKLDRIAQAQNDQIEEANRLARQLRMKVCR